MTTELSSQEERDDFKHRQELQLKLQAAIRRSAPDSEIRNIQQEIGKLNRKLEDYASRVRKTIL